MGMAPRITTFAELFPGRLRDYPDKAGDVYVYIPRPGQSPIRRRIGPAGARSQALAREVIASEARSQIGAAAGLAPLFVDYAARYLESGMDLYQLASETQTSVRYRIKVLMKRWPRLRLDEIGGELMGWWEDHVVRQGREPETGRRWLSALSGVYRYAATHGVQVPNPVRGFLPTVLTFGRTKAGRAAKEDTARPIESAAELRAFEAAALEVGDPDVWLIVLLMLDHGERSGEVFGARGFDMELGESADDTRRLVHLRKNRPGRSPEQAPKSGKPRAMPMSRRLRQHLRDHYAFSPPMVPLLHRFIAAAKARAKNPENATGAAFFARMQFPRILKRAGLPAYRSPKDLRDTFASHLLSAGFPQLQVMRWIGHAPGSVSMFRQRYARWIGEDTEWSYRPPVTLAPGEVPTDYLARLSASAPAAALSGPLPHPKPSRHDRLGRFGEDGLFYPGGRAADPLFGRRLRTDKG